MANLRQGPKVAWTEMDDQVVILDPRGERYFHELNPTASFIWKKLDGDTSKKQIISALAEEFDVVPNQAQSDFDLFIDQLKGQNLIEL